MKKAVSIFLGLVFVLIFTFAASAQKKNPTPNVNRPKVTLVDEVGIKTALKPNGKPLLVNFWATWCDPCREEFPDLVKIDAEYKGRIDFITVSLDDPADINTLVPKFLSEQKAEMPAYLLKTADESAVISSIAKDWSGGLPFTILYNENGEIAFFRQGKVKVEMMRAEIEKLISKPTQTTAFENGKADAQNDIAKGVLRFKANFLNRRRGFTQEQVRENYGITIDLFEYSEENPALNNELMEYAKGYNSISETEIEKRFGELILKKLKTSFYTFSIVNIDELILTINSKP